MGVFITQSGIADDLYETANKWLGHLKGGLAISTIAACGGMAAISGSSLATAATMTKVAIPAMRRYNYNDSISAATVAAGGTLGILIPPSIALIIYGLLAEADIGKLFMAGIVPGILTIIVYMIAIWVVSLLRPEWVPRGERTSWRERFRTLHQIWSMVALFMLIMGGIFFGVFTAAEGGGIGAGGALIIAIFRKRMSLKIFISSLQETGRTTAMVFTVGFGAIMLNQFVIISGAPEQVLEAITSFGFGPWGGIVVILFCYLILGMFIGGPAMIFLTVPIFVPLVQSLDLPMTPSELLIWWGILVVTVVEISLITPPIGMNLFIIASMIPDLSLRTIYKGIIPDRVGLERVGKPVTTPEGRLHGQGHIEPFDRDDGIHTAELQKKAPPPQYNAWLNSLGYEGDNPWHDYANSVETPEGEIISGWNMRSAPYPARLPAEHSETAYFTNRAKDFIEETGDQPWLLHLSFIKPH
ncbi:MAG: C4-dicarboxylate ABC transporter permease [Rhodobacteraceae bacterium]|nr:MAG: C4-dicarboxylate ABC transporter permease [Paracoccaceae bacterium]